MPTTTSSDDLGPLKIPARRRGGRLPVIAAVTLALFLSGCDEWYEILCPSDNNCIISPTHRHDSNDDSGGSGQASQQHQGGGSGYPN